MVRCARHWSGKWALFLSITLFAAAATYSAAADFVTYDEVGNIAAGLSYLETGRYHLYSANPPLSKLIATYPIWLTGPRLEAVLVPDEPGFRNEWDAGGAFAQQNQDWYATYVFMGRLGVIPWALVASVVLYRWVNQVAGAPGGIVAAVCWLFNPEVLGHGHLVTADVPGAAGGILAAYGFRSYLRGPSWPMAVSAGVLLGLAESLKFTLLVLYPIWAACGLVLAMVRGVKLGCRAGVGVCGQMAVIFAASLVVIGACYEFEGVGRRIDRFPFVSSSLKGVTGESVGNRFAGSRIGKLPSLLPEHYVRGIDVQRFGMDAYESKLSFLGGEWKRGGWWYYYLYAAAVKLPVGLLLLGIIGLLAGVRHLRQNDPWGHTLALAMPVAVLVAVSANQSLNKHFRYVLPALPFGAMAAGSAVVCCRNGNRTGRLAVCGLVGWSVISTGLAYPHMIPYFNELGGGPAQGYRHLSGSNVDLGQDLWRLKRWLANHPTYRPDGLAYYNHIDTRVAGVSFPPPPVGPCGDTPQELNQQLNLGPHPGRYLVTVRYLQGSSGRMPDGSGGFVEVPQHGYAYFAYFEPTARVGYTMFVYDLTLDEVNRVRSRIGLVTLSGSALPGRLATDP